MAKRLWLKKLVFGWLLIVARCLSVCRFRVLVICRLLLLHNRIVISMQQSMVEIGFGRDIKLGRWRRPMLGVCTSRNATHVDKRRARTRSHGL